MRRIVFQRLQAIDFKVYTDLSFDFLHYGPGCHSIRGVNNVVPRLGSNGAGKSTLWDALTFALYGRTTKRLRSTDLVPHGTTRCPTVRLWLSVNGYEHLIERRAVPHALKLDDVTCGQERIEQLIGIDLDLFLHTIILAQGQPLFLNLEPRNKLAMLSDVMHLDRFEAYSDTAAEAVAQLKQEDGRQLNQRGIIDGQLHEAERHRAELQRLSEAFAASQADEVERRRLALDAAQQAASAAAIPVMAATVDLDAAELELKDAHAAAIAAQVAHNEGIRLRIRVGRMTIGSACPQCGQPVTAAARQKLSDAAEAMVAGSRYPELKQKLDRLQELERDSRNAYRGLVDDERRATQALGEALANLERIAQAANPHAAQLDALGVRIDKLAAAIGGIEAERQRLAIMLQRIEPWVTGFKAIRLIVLDDVLATLSVLTTSYANELGLPANVTFEIERATKSGTLVSGVHVVVDGVERFESWSGGEAQRLRLAASLALSATLLTEAGLSFNLLALDEPSTGLSDEGLAELTGFLSRHAEAEGRSIFFTDQRRVQATSSITLTRGPDGVHVGP